MWMYAMITRAFQMRLRVHFCQKFHRYNVLLMTGFLLLVPQNLHWGSSPQIVNALGTSNEGKGMFISLTEKWLEEVDTNQRNYGMAVSDVDNDGDFEIIVAGFTGANLVLKYNRVLDRMENIASFGSPYDALRDLKGQAIGVAACDIDGDGREEIYFLNTNDAYAGVSSYSDKLFKWRDGRYIDLYSDEVNSGISTKNYTGRSVACLDRYGSGKYGFMIATYAHKGKGSFSLIEMDEYHQDNDIHTGYLVLRDSATDAGLQRSTGGRGLVVGPILNSQGRSDIFFANEGNGFLGNRGDNFLMKNMGNGTFIDVARQYGISDDGGAGRGVQLADFNEDGLLDIVYGNYEGANKLWIQTESKNGQTKFINIATPEFEEKCPIRSLLVADFDNDGHSDIFFNNIDDNIDLQPNRLFTVTSYGPGNDPGINKIDIGEALEADGYGTGAVYSDLNKDGSLELFISHGETVAQPIEVYHAAKGSRGRFLRIHVFTKYGAPARGATVEIRTYMGRKMKQVIDGGSGYLCQMEPIAHFGLGSRDKVNQIIIHWPDQRDFYWTPKEEDISMTLAFYHPDFRITQNALRASNMTTTTVANMSENSHVHKEL